MPSHPPISLSIEAEAKQGLVRPLVTLFILLSLVCGLIYPAVVNGLGQLFFPAQVAGSLLKRNGEVVGSALIGQPFSSPSYFWSRPSATAPMAYNAAASSGSNLGPLNPAQMSAVKTRIDALKAADPDNIKPVPVDLVTASASGLDPDISLAGAFYQSERVARQRHLDVVRVNQLINQLGLTQHFGFLGEPRINVLALNLALDKLSSAPIAADDGTQANPKP